MSAVDDSGREFRVDLTNCDKEPIHVPGHVQPFGALLALNPVNLQIEQVSENVGVRFGISAAELLGAPIESLLTPAQLESLAYALSTDRVERNPLHIFTDTIAGVGPYHVVVHSFRDVLILEAEDEDRENRQPDYHGLIKKTLVRLQETATLAEFCQALAEESREVNGFDRVLIYRFLEDASGTVVGESLAPGMESFMGLHYPASDIPAQARQLFMLNATRLIANPSYEPSVVVPTLNPRTGKPLDMSFAAIRGVSPIHCQYLRNMGVGTSMSQAIVVDGKLWGLISSHHRVPRLVPYDERTACEFLAKSASLMVHGKVVEEQSAYAQQARDQHDHLLISLAQQPTIVDGLTETPGIESYVNAAGCAILADGECYLSGQTPSPEAVKRLAAWIRIEHPEEVYATDSLAREYADAESIKDAASGVLSIRVTKAAGECVLWFRPEKPKTVNWAGNPDKPVEPGPFGDQLHPRKSFELWQQEVRMTSAPWKESEIEAARRLRIAITEVVLRRAEEVSRANVRLERSNVELDSFAYIASHDLKEPLRGINNYATFLLEDYAEVLDQAGQDRLHTLVRLAERMEALTDSLLQYSRLGRQELDLRDVDLNVVLEEAIDATGARLLETGTEVRVPWPLPTMRCDKVQFVEVFQNLISNAAKYNNKDEKWIEVGFQRGGTLPTEQPYLLYVRDNGIGIPAKHHETIFRIFKRLHGRNDFGGGSGAGLTITQKIVERHGGRLWLESQPGEGSTFFVTLGT